MVTIIHGSKSFRGTLNYNEHKVEEGKAQCIAAGNYPKNVEALNFLQKLNRLTNQAALNERVQVNCVHISLNFDAGEQVPTEKMISIADTYMQRIGFGDQPYLVYQHQDAGHPHIHIVSTNIKSDGKRIPLHNLGKNVSEPARKAIEHEFGLVVASNKKLKEAYVLPAVKIKYGQSQTRRAIAQVLQSVIQQYKFTSLEELNAVLKMYNVAADRGLPGSRTYQRRGLVYRVLDEQGVPVGAPVKASLIHFKPTLASLEKKYVQHETDRKPHRQRVKTAVDWALHGRPLTIGQLIRTLEKENIQIVVRSNAAGKIYGMTYIDHRTKCVFNGSDLGKSYTAKGILERCIGEQAVAASAKPALELGTDVRDEGIRGRLLGLEQWWLAAAPQQSSAQEPSIGKKKKRKRRPKL